MTEENNELENCRKQCDEYLNGWRRAKADYLNLKKEMESQNKEIKEWMSKIFLMPLLTIMDSFDKAFNIAPANLVNEQWFWGVSGIKKQFEDYLKTRGVEEMKTLGEVFDPLKHEAVESTEGEKSNTVAEELQKGYMINEEILRPAKVKVFK